MGEFQELCGAASDAPGRQRARSLRVLCVEDEPSLRRSMVRLLQLFGHLPSAVPTAEEALERLEIAPFELVISDLRLPGMSGAALREAIEARHPLLGGRVLLMSGFFPEGEPVPPFLPKPFDVGQLRAAILDIFQS